MKIKIFGSKENTKELNNKVKLSLEELGLNDFVTVELTNETKLKEELDIKKEPALIVEEEAIDFKDTIFEGIIPSDDEIKSMFISIIGGTDNSGCEPSDCGTCGMGC